jgi:predicted nucleotidyltransferase
MLSRSEITQEIRDRLAPLFARADIQLVILFGSTARGVTHRRSDLDVAILAKEPLDVVETATQVMALLRRSDVDVVDLRRASPLLAMEVVRSGILLYEREPGEYATVCSLAHRRYVDTTKLRLARREALKRFLETKGLV